MIPEIIIYEEGRLVITAAAFGIPEIKAILDKFGNAADAYVLYVWQMSHPLAPYINLPKEETKEMAVYDVIQTMGDFDPEDDLLEPAIKRLKEMYESRVKRYYDALGVVMDKVIGFAGRANINEDNFGEANKMLKEGGAIMRSYRDSEKQVEEELKTKMKGKAKLGDY